MKWNNLYLIKLSPDKIINESSTTYRKYYSIPKGRRFVPLNDQQEKTKADSGWTILGQGSLSGLTLSDKLMIVAHGSHTDVAGRQYNVLANELEGWGLQEVGLITFKCCNVGRLKFLEDFVRFAGTVSGIKIGWVKAYRGPSVTLPGGLIKPTERIGHVSSHGAKSGQKRYKIVPGLTAFTLPGSRYIAYADLEEED